MYRARSRAHLGEPCVVSASVDRPHTSMQKKRWSVIKFAFLWVRPRPGETTEPRTIASDAPSLPASVLWAIVCDVSGRIPFMCRTGTLIAAFCMCAVCKYTVSSPWSHCCRSRETDRGVQFTALNPSVVNDQVSSCSRANVSR